MKKRKASTPLSKTAKIKKRKALPASSGTPKTKKQKVSAPSSKTIEAEGTDGTMKDPSRVILETPEEALRAIDETSERAGGEWASPPGSEGSIGRTMFDTPASKDGTITVLMSQQNIDKLPGQALVRIESQADLRTYLGAVVEGPFAEPDGLRADSTPMVVTTVQGGLLMPPYHGRAQVEIIGERLAEDVVVPPRHRPKPNSPVFVLGTNESAQALQISEGLRLGLAEGYEELPVNIPAKSKSIFPRHLGILGTTGGGKSTTVSGLVAKAQTEQMAVILIDTEGEYCAINEKSEDPQMLQALDRRGLRPGGVEDTYIHHLVGKETANPDHKKVTEFSLRFSALSPYAVQEILELSEAQGERFFKAYDVTKLALERTGIWPANEQDRRRLLELDEFETGYPKMTLAHLYDVVKEIAAIVGKDSSQPNLEQFHPIMSHGRRSEVGRVWGRRGSRERGRPARLFRRIGNHRNCSRDTPFQ